MEKKLSWKQLGKNQWLIILLVGVLLVVVALPTDKKKDVGATYMIAGIIDGNLEDLVNVLDLANKGQNPRVTRAMLDSYIDNPDTDIDQLCEDVLGFLRSANATKKTVIWLEEKVEEAKAKQNQD